MLLLLLAVSLAEDDEDKVDEAAEAEKEDIDGVPPFRAGGANAELRNRATTVAPAQPNACPPTDEKREDEREEAG